MNQLDTQVARKAAGKMTKTVADLTEKLARGQIQSFDAYKAQCGRIAGLHDAISLLQEAERELLAPSPTENR